jgi:hypothetical protein
MTIVVDSARKKPAANVATAAEAEALLLEQVSIKKNCGIRFRQG